jgi:autotransporter-associated beta strand protein
VGTLTGTGNATFGPGGNYNVQVADATGGPGLGWDRLSVAGTLSIAATAADPFKVNLWSVLAGSPAVSGSAANFSPSTGYTWTIASAGGGISEFVGNKFTVNTTPVNGTGGFANSLAGGSFAVAQSGTDLNLVFTPFVPGTQLFWFGNGSAAGGSGTWSSAGLTWNDGASTGTWTPTRTAVFDTAPGTVTVAPGGISANRGLAFAVGGYTLSGGTITLGGATAADNAIDVSNAATATIGSPLAGATGMTKTGFGTLVLTGSSNYTGGTVVSGGALQVGAGGATGSIAGDVTVADRKADALESFLSQAGDHEIAAQARD